MSDCGAAWPATPNVLVPDVESALARTYGRAIRRRRVRGGALALAAAAAIAVGAWALDLPGSKDDVAPVTPNPTPNAPTDLVGLHGPLEPGLYSMAAWGESTSTGPLPRAIVDVPEGYFSNGGYAINAGIDGVTDDQYGDISVWHPVQVLADPCRRRTATDVGPTVADLARGLVGQAGPSTRPRPVVLDGHPGLAMEVNVPPDTDLTRCTDENYTLWRTERRGDGALGLSHPGVVNHLWILDVDGTRLVAIASLFPDESVALHREQLTIAESIDFEAPHGPRLGTRG